MTSPRLVIDASVAIAWRFVDEDSRYAASVLDALRHRAALVPTIWPLEIGNVLLLGERRRRISQAETVRFMELLNNLPIRVEQEQPERMLNEILALARELELTTYDASYLDLAMRAGLPIATLDKRLRRAALQCAVPVFDSADV